MRISALSWVLACLVGCASTDSGQAPLAGTDSSSEVTSEVAVDEEAEEAAREESATALEECQAATELVDKDDVRGALKRVDQCYALMLGLPEGEANAQAKRDLRLLAAELIAKIYSTGTPRTQAPMSSWDLGMPLVDNDNVQREIKSFTTTEREDFIEAYRRSGRYRPAIVAKLQAAGMPTQLSWLPLVESSFKVNALSRAAALGLWQFISSTGLRYGLRRDAWVDERLDPEKATDAAIAYLGDLHQMFGDWPKALAAYNCGESRVQSLQQRSPGEYLDFWDMFALLPRETRRYFPRLVAVLQLVENPARYGLTLPEPDAADPETTKLTIERPVRLGDIEKALRLADGALNVLNPELRHAATPSGTYALRVPAARANEVTSIIGTLATYEPPREPEYVTYRVRSGETLSQIAERYHVGLSTLMRVNGLRRADRIWPGQRLRIPMRG